MPDILLATLNAKYPHAAFGLRYLMANLAPAGLADRAAMLEFDVNQRPLDVVEAILAQSPRIVGLGVYIWNAAQTTLVAADLKRLRPDLTLVLGGPEVSHETDQQEITRYADYVITGEADLAFADLCDKLLSGRRPLQKVIAADLPEFEPKKGSGLRVQGSANTAETTEPLPPSPKGAADAPSPAGTTPVGEASGMGDRPRAGGGEGRATSGSPFPTNATRAPSPILNPEPRTLNPLRLPYHLYTETDLAHRVVYVEASRGCPFKCEFCLSSLDVPVRNVPLDAFLAAMQDLLDRGLRQFKFVDRTFNLNLNVSRAILQFFLDRHTPGLFLHFEMIPDRLPEALRSLIRQFPPGALQFEVGIQTFNEDVSERISRRQDNARLEDNLRFLREQTGVHIHTDLIVGLPGEDLDSFAAGFDRLIALRPQEIQVGILKRLRGTPIVRHDAEWGMVYSPHPPYEILRTKLLDFPTMQRLRRFSRYWDLIGNSGNFRDTLPLLWAPPTDDPSSPPPSPFWRFLDLGDRLYASMGRNHGIALQALAEFLFAHLTAHLRHPPDLVADRLWTDYQRAGRSDRPGFLRPFIADRPIPRRPAAEAVAPARQARQARQARHL